MEFYDSTTFGGDFFFSVLSLPFYNRAIFLPWPISPRKTNLSTAYGMIWIPARSIQKLATLGQELNRPERAIGCLSCSRSYRSPKRGRERNIPRGRHQGSYEGRSRALRATAMCIYSSYVATRSHILPISLDLTLFVFSVVVLINGVILRLTLLILLSFRVINYRSNLGIQSKMNT